MTFSIRLFLMTLKLKANHQPAGTIDIYILRHFIFMPRAQIRSKPTSSFIAFVGCGLLLDWLLLLDFRLISAGKSEDWEVLHDTSEM